jgi:hypothetical protein
LCFHSEGLSEETSSAVKASLGKWFLLWRLHRGNCFPGEAFTAEIPNPCFSGDVSLVKASLRKQFPWWSLYWGNCFSGEAFTRETISVVKRWSRGNQSFTAEIEDETSKTSPYLPFKVKGTIMQKQIIGYTLASNLQKIFIYNWKLKKKIWFPQ